MRERQPEREQRGKGVHVGRRLVCSQRLAVEPASFQRHADALHLRAGGAGVHRRHGRQADLAPGKPVLNLIALGSGLVAIILMSWRRGIWGAWWRIAVGREVRRVRSVGCATVERMVECHGTDTGKVASSVGRLSRPHGAEAVGELQSRVNSPSAEVLRPVPSSAWVISATTCRAYSAGTHRAS